MEKGQEIAASASEKGPEQLAIDVSRDEHGEGKGVDGANVEAVEKERLAVVEEPQKKKSRRVAALDAFRGLTIVVWLLYVYENLFGRSFIHRF